MEALMAAAANVAGYTASFLLLLALGGALADYTLPRCPRLLKLAERVLQVDLSSGKQDTRPYKEGRGNTMNRR